MAKKYTAAIPDSLDLTANFIVQVTAVDPTTGALVSGVNISGVAIVADSVTPATSVDTGHDYAPLFVPLLENPA